MATINLGKVITDAQKAVLDRQSYDSENQVLNVRANENVAGKLTGDEIVENMPRSDYYLGAIGGGSNITLTYVGICKNGNKITFVVAGKANRPTGETWGAFTTLKSVEFRIPASVGSKIYPMGAGSDSSIIAGKKISALYAFNSYATLNTSMTKNNNISLTLTIYGTGDDTFTEERDYAFRYEETFLLSDNLVQ